MCWLHVLLISATATAPYITAVAALTPVHAPAVKYCAIVPIRTDSMYDIETATCPVYMASFAWANG